MEDYSWADWPHWIAAGLIILFMIASVLNAFLTF